MTDNYIELTIGDATKIQELFDSLSEESKSQCLIYISALRDKELMDSEKTAG